MKISEMNTKQAAACLCKIAAPLGRIGEDKALNGYLKTLGASKGKTALELISGAMATLVPVLMENHYEDMITILAAMTGKESAQIEAQNILVTIRDAKNVIDKDVLDFFTASSATDGEK